MMMSSEATMNGWLHLIDISSEKLSERRSFEKQVQKTPLAPRNMMEKRNIYISLFKLDDAEDDVKWKIETFP